MRLSAEQVKAARALLAWSQQDLANDARVSVSTVADFERGVRTPTTNNAQAIRDVLEGKGLEFVAGGVVEGGLLLPPPPKLRPGMLVRWVNATHLAQWAGRRDAQADMPELANRLIYATVGPAARLRFPSGDSVQHKGWDGICKVAEGSGPVPGGISVWEIGVQRDGIARKADEDFGKRSAEPLGHEPCHTTFVFLTPQRFGGKDKWVLEKKALGIWRDVVVIDADDLVHWLETCPAVAQWLSARIGRRPKDLRNLEEVWAEWIGATRTPFTPDLVVVGRDDEQAAVLKWLRDKPGLFALQAEAPDEAVAFLYSAIHPLPIAHRLHYWSRCVVARTEEAARELVGLGTPLVVVLVEPEAGLARKLVDDGHHVFAAYGPGFVGSSASRRLQRPWRWDLRTALIDARVGEEEANRLSHASGRSLTVLRRLMPAAPDSRPDWARQASPELIAAMFAGAWDETSVRDQEIIGLLADRPYKDVEAALAPLAATGGPLVRLGELWKVVSLRDLWTQVGPQVTLTQLSKFEAAFGTVLGTINPRYDRRPESVFYEKKEEFGAEASGPLRQGLTEAMIALAVYPDRAELVADVANRVQGAIGRLLDQASRPLWWSLSSDLRNIAEAAPRAFLNALDAGLDGVDPPVMSLFRSDEGAFHPTEYLSHLLWALEMLARSPDYLADVAVLLARLHENDPGGKWGNRPFASLRRIFVTWSPQTYAGPTDRLKVLDRVLRSCPGVGWKLLIALAPRPHDVSEPSAMPNWRDFATDMPEAVTMQSVIAANTAIGNRLLAQAGHHGDRWRALLNHWGNFDGDWRAAATMALRAFVEGTNDPGEREAMRDKLRSFLGNHRSFKDAQWALPEKVLEPLDEVVGLLPPQSVEERVRWLFRPGADQAVPDVDFTVRQRALATRQQEAAGELLAGLSPERLIAFASTISSHHELGAALAKARGQEEAKFALLKQGLLAEQDHLADLGIGILFGLGTGEVEQGEAMTRDLWRRAIEEGWGERAETRIILCLQPSQSTWTEIEARSESLAAAYWRSIPNFRIPSEADPAYVVEHLEAAGRARHAVAWLGNNMGARSVGALMVSALKAAARSGQDSDRDDAGMFSHWVGVILDRLETDPKVSEKDVVGLEWIYFQLLRHSQRAARSLHRALSHDAGLFVDLVKLIYLPAEGSGVVEPEPENPEAARNMARQAYDVLSEWKQVPGADEGGRIDPAALESWVKDARKLLAAAGRIDIGDSMIGEMLSAAARSEGAPWPPVPVCEVIEIARSRALEKGFEVGVYNHRGVTIRMPHDGGAQERVLAEAYRRDARALRFDWPRISACLERIAVTYDVDAGREDLSAEQRDWL